MIIKYRTGSFGKLIEVVEVQRETDKSVFICGRKSAKRSNYENYFDSWEGARAHLIAKAQRTFDSINRAFEAAQLNLEEAEAIPGAPS